MIADLTGTEAVSRGAGRIIDWWLRSGQWPNLTVVDVDTLVARAAAGLRARRGFSPPDALILGTAIAAAGAGAVRVITGDERWRARPAVIPAAIAVVCLYDHVPFD